MNSTLQSIRSLPVIESGAWMAIALTAVLCANGIWWGGTEIWNADQMAFKDFFREGYLPFSPEKFDKPPLLSYINFVFSVVPREAVVVGLEIVSGKEYGNSLDFLSVWLAKLLQLLFACACVYLVWRAVANFSSHATAMIAALLLATAAGFIVQAHLITTDLPLVFMMLLAFWSCQRIVTRGQMRDYVLAGLLVGLTGAMKYNGLIVGIAIPVFHVFRSFEGKLLPVIFNRRLFVSVAIVPIGFLTGNPFALIEYRRFATDLQYLFATSQDFVGAGGDVLQEAHLMLIIGNDLIGWPLLIFLSIAIPVSIVIALRGKATTAAASVVAAALTCFTYGLYLFPRSNVHVRWVLPVVPFALIAASSAIEGLRNRLHRFSLVAYTALILFGLVCSVWVGIRFASDPRFDALEWVAANVPVGSRIESSNYTPEWEKHWSVSVDDVRMPNVSGRRRLYEQEFADDHYILKLAQEFERESQERIEWYSVEKLSARNPDYVAVSSLYYGRFMFGRLAGLYPEMRQFFIDLQSPESAAGYRAVFEASCCEPLPLLYPQSIMFLDNQITIYRRAE